MAALEEDELAKELGKQLWHASMNGQAAEAARLLDLNAPINHVHREDQAINVAAQNGRIEVVKLLVNRGADLEAGGTTGQTALMAAAARGHLPVVQFLAKRGANLEARSNAGTNSLMFASKNGHLAVVKYLAGQVPSVSINLTNNQGTDALLWAAAFGHVDTVLFLISQGGDPRVVDKYNWSGLTHFGLKQKFRPCKEELKRMQAQILSAWKAGLGDRVAAAELVDSTAAAKLGIQLYSASLSGHAAEVGRLLDLKAPINQRAGGQWTPINGAAHSGHIEVIKLLEKRGADLEAGTTSGQTPAMSAAINGHIEVLRFLAEKQVNLAARCKSGHNALMFASKYGHLEVVKFVAGIPGINVNSKTKNGSDALLYAALRGHVAIALFLISCGGDPHVTNQESFSALTHFGSRLDPRPGPDEQTRAQAQFLAAWEARPLPDADSSFMQALASCLCWF
jgi:ankyrin repeat protein